MYLRRDERLVGQEDLGALGGRFRVARVPEKSKIEKSV